MGDSLLESIVQFDREIGQIVSNQPTRAIPLLMQEYQLSNDRQAFVAALIGRLVVLEARHPSDKGVNS